MHHNFRVFTNTSERFTIDSSGQVNQCQNLLTSVAGGVIGNWTTNKLQCNGTTLF